MEWHLRYLQHRRSAAEVKRIKSVKCPFRVYQREFQRFWGAYSITNIHVMLVVVRLNVWGTYMDCNPGYLQHWGSLAEVESLNPKYLVDWGLEWTSNSVEVNSPTTLRRVTCWYYCCPTGCLRGMWITPTRRVSDSVGEPIRWGNLFWVYP